jgi:O-antigen ligase/polysaccharide polymerase Wzy-like membrane protein
VLVRGLALACAAALIGVACGRVAISHYGVPAIEVLVAVPVLVLMIPRPYLACVLLLVLLCTVPFYTWLPRANVPGHPPINLGDILLLLTVGATLWRKPARGWPPVVRRLYLALAVMLALALIPTVIVALHGHGPARDAIAGYKDLLFMTIGLTVALELSGRLWWPVVNGAIVVAAIVALLSILAAVSGAIGHVLTNFDATAVLNAAADTTVGTTSRIRLPGLFLVYAMTIPTLVMVLLIKDRWRWMRLVALALMVGAIAVSLNRNMYFGAVAGLLVTLLVGGPHLRHRFLVVAAIVAAMIAIAVQSALAPSVTAEVAARAQSALSTSVLQSSSLTDRADEFSHALTSIAQHPWFGVGWFQNYGSYAGEMPRLGVEDWYLHIATDLGLPVTFAFLAIVGALLSYGVRRARQATNPLDRGLVAAGVGALTALLLSLIVGTYLQDPNTMTAFGFTCGFLVAAGLRAVPAAAPSATGGADHRSLVGRGGDCA